MAILSSTIASHSVLIAYIICSSSLSFFKKLILLAFYPKIRFVNTLIPVLDCWNILLVTSAKARVKLFPRTVFLAAYSLKNVLTKASPIINWLSARTSKTYFFYVWVYNFEFMSLI